jgi:hypothetical protein
LAAVNWILSPDEAMRWLRALLMLPALWLAMTLWHLSTLKSLRRRGIDDESAITRYFASALALVLLAVGLWQIVAFGLEIWGRLGGHRTDLEVERRILGLTACAVFVIIGNALPKILTPLSILPREEAELVTVARRFVGTTLVILGLVLALACLSAPLALAGALLQYATGAALLTILGAIVWMNVSAARRTG